MSWARFAFGGAAFAVALACASCNDAGVDSSQDDTQPKDIVGELLSEVSREGPVTATVELRPKEPTLGDRLELTLSVEAEAGVNIQMPDYDPALGRFDVLKHSASEATSDDGKQVFKEHYALQATRSGRMRIPRLRIEFDDKRPTPASSTATTTTAIDPAGGASGAGESDASAGVRELLTEELAITVAAVLPDEARGQSLPAAPGTLDAAFGQNAWTRYRWLLLPILALCAFLFFVWRRMKARSQTPVVVDPYEAAMERMNRLKAQGVPSENDLDEWYVELSSIIRHYVEGRFSVRAPELTTEEFLREAQHSKQSELSSEHKTLLGELLAGCDRVKFGRYRPANEEIEGALDIAAQFIQETKERAPTVAPLEAAA